MDKDKWFSIITYGPSHFFAFFLPDLSWMNEACLDRPYECLFIYAESAVLWKSCHSLFSLQLHGGTKQNKGDKGEPQVLKLFWFALFGGTLLGWIKNAPSTPLAPSLSPASVHLPHSSRVEVSEPPKNRLSILMFVLLTWGKHIAQTITKVSCSHRGLVDIVSCDPRWPWASHDLYFSWKSKGTPPMPPTQEIRPY